MFELEDVMGVVDWEVGDWSNNRMDGAGAAFAFLLLQQTLPAAGAYDGSRPLLAALLDRPQVVNASAEGRVSTNEIIRDATIIISFVWKDVSEMMKSVLHIQSRPTPAMNHETLTLSLPATKLTSPPIR